MSREPKLDKKSLKLPDFFVSGGRRLLESLFLERRGAAAGVVVVVVLVLGYYAYDAYTSRALMRDWEVVYKAEEAKGSDQVAQYKQAYEKGGGSRASYIAAVNLADHYLEAVSKKDLEPALTPEQAAQNALEWYTKALGFSGLLPAETELLTLSTGHALEAQKKMDEAIAKYKSVADKKGQSRPLALLYLGRAQESKQDKEAAKSSYRAIVSEFGTSEYASLAKNYLRSMESPLLQESAAKK